MDKPTEATGVLTQPTATDQKEAIWGDSIRESDEVRSDQRKFDGRAKFKADNEIEELLCRHFEEHGIDPMEICRNFPGAKETVWHWYIKQRFLFVLSMGKIKKAGGLDGYGRMLDAHL